MAGNGAVQAGLTPDQAVDRLEHLHAAACDALREALARFTRSGEVPSPQQRALFRYPELRVDWRPSGTIRFTRRAWAKFQEAGLYCTTVTQPAHFRRYLLEQLTPLTEEFGARLDVGTSEQEIPYPFVTEAGDEFIHGDLSVTELARHFPTPVLANVGDEIADGTWVFEDRTSRPLALFDALRVDFSLRRLIHYTGTDWRTIQPWILATNYQRYIDHFLTWAMEELAKPDGPYTQLVLPGGAVVRRGDETTVADAAVLAAPWHRFQMPAYNLLRGDGGGGVTIINIG